MKPQEEQELLVQIEQVSDRLAGLRGDLRAVEGEVESLAPQREHHELLHRACDSLEKLGEMGAASLFWGDGVDIQRISDRLSGAREKVSAFQAHLDELDAQRQELLSRIARESGNLEILDVDLDEIREAEERRKQEWIVEREMGPEPARARQMAWTRGGEDDRRFRRSLAASLAISVIFGALLPTIDLPVPARFLPEEMPRRLAQLVREEQARFMTPPPAPEPPQPKKTEPEKPKPQDKPKQAEPRPEAPAIASAKPLPQDNEPLAPFLGGGPPGPEAPAVAEPPPRQVAQAGILAFKDKFASLAQDKVGPRLGADARLSNADDSSRGAMSTRSMLTTNAPGSSGGINLASLSRNVGGGGGGSGGGGGGGGLHGVQVGRATSAIAGIGGGGRPMARGGPGPSRTDEEIQIVFDRYKASFYRLYNRELRNDPTLQGQMVLRLTIEPDGSVSMCKLESSDMDAPALAAQVVERVLTINFGAKEGVQALTIVYPIDFLPAA